MNKNTQSVLMALLGGLLISITVSGRFTAYVKPGFGPLLLIAGAVLIVVGLLSIVLGVRADRRADLLAGAVPRARRGGSHPAGAFEGAPDPGERAGDEAHDHSHDRSKAPWLILAPVLALLIMAPPALGAAAVNRNAGSQALAGVTGVAPPAAAGADVAAGGAVGGYAPNDGSGHGMGTAAFAKKRPTMAFPALPGGTDPTLTLKDFVLRALYDAGNSVSDNDITVIAFVAPAGDGFTDGYSLARLTISCCAADATPMRVHVDGTSRYPSDTWVSVVLSARPGTADADNEYVPTVDVTSMRPIAQPADPYEH